MNLLEHDHCWVLSTERRIFLTSFEHSLLHISYLVTKCLDSADTLLSCFPFLTGMNTSTW